STAIMLPVAAADAGNLDRWIKPPKPASQIEVAALADAQPLLLAAGGVLPWNDAKPGGQRRKNPTYEHSKNDKSSANRLLTRDYVSPEPRLVRYCIRENSIALAKLDLTHPFISRWFIHCTLPASQVKLTRS